MARPKANSLSGRRYLPTVQPFTLLCIAFSLVALLLYGIGITNFEKPYFDELINVPAARALLDLGVNQIVWHPPLHNHFIAVGIAIFGDNPWGWRMLSVLAGVLLLLGMLHICFYCGLGLRRIIYVGCLALTSHFIYIHARLAKADIFFCALLVWALAMLLNAYTTSGARRKKIMLVSSAFLWGLASSVKWLGLIGFIICIGHFVLLRTLGKSFSPRSAGLTWNSTALLSGISTPYVFIAYTAAYLGGYILTYLPTGEMNFVADAKKIWDLQHSIASTHTYNSSAWQWPLMLRPIWYGFHPAEDGWTRAVFCLGNPVLMLGGLLSLLWSGWCWYRHGSLLACLAVVFYAGFYGFWLVTARAAAFHYYYFPALLFLLLSLGDNGSALLARHKLWGWRIVVVAALFFIYYLPVISGAAVPVSGDNLHLWTWFRSWR